MAQSMNKKRDILQVVIGKFPHLKEKIVAYPGLVNSLIDTGRINELNVSGGAYINTNLRFGADNASGFRFCINGAFGFTQYVWNLHGTSYSRNSCCIGFSPSRYLSVGNGDSVSELRYAPELIGKNRVYDLRFSEDGSKVTIAIGVAGMEGYEYVAAISAYVPASSTSLYLFRCNGQVSTFDGSIREVIIETNGVVHRLVPYVQDGHAGLLDLTDLSFHGNASATGVITISEQPAVTFE